TAVAICGGCAVRAVCMEAALQKPENELHGIMAGLTPQEIRMAKRWESYDLGVIDEMPTKPRPLFETPTYSDASQAVAEYRRNADLTFEERVLGVFLDLRNGKYNEAGGIAQAIGAIAFIRDQMEA